MVRQWLTGSAVFAVFDLPWVPVYVFIMFIMHPILGYASLILIIILIIFGLYFSRILGNQDELLRMEEYETNDFLYGKLRNSEVLSVYALATNFKKKWMANKRKFYISLNNSQKKTDAIQNIMKQYRFFSNSLALTIGALLVIHGDLTLGSMIAASLLMARTTQPVDGAVAALSRITIVREAFWRLEEMLTLPVSNKISPKKNETNLKNMLSKGIDLRNVSVSFSGREERIFENLSLSVRPGELTAIIGSSGVGKTTFIKLLSGLVDYEGTIKFDNFDLKNFSSRDFENCVGYLPQDVLMIPGSVAENIAGLREPDSEGVIKVSKLVGIHEFILKFPNGYDTVLFGGYQNLSGGERQRIGLARAIYNHPACLFLDEPNAALDHSGELALKNAANYCKNLGMVIMVVTHRRSVLDYADYVLDLENNKDVKLLKKEDYLKGFSSKEEFDKKFTF